MITVVTKTDLLDSVYCVAGCVTFSGRGCRGIKFNYTTRCISGLSWFAPALEVNGDGLAVTNFTSLHQLITDEVLLMNHI